MRVGIVDVGANTLRLLVAAGDRDGGLELLREDRRQLGLGEEIEKNGGPIGDEKLAEAAAVAQRHVRRARKLNCDVIEVLVTSPGRQATNAKTLIEVLGDVTGVGVRALDAAEEGALAWRGATARAENLPETVGVCDVGGGSAQLIVGTLSNGPAWIGSANLGSLRLTRRTFQHDPPTEAEIDAAREEVRAAFLELVPPLPLGGLATGGTARALRRVVGPHLDAAKLDVALRKLARRSSRDIARDFGVERARARTVTAGTIVMAEAQRRFRVPLTVARGGLREGAAIALLEEAVAATG